MMTFQRLLLPLLISGAAACAAGPESLEFECAERCDETGALALESWQEGSSVWEGQVETGQVYTLEMAGIAGQRTLNLELPPEFEAKILRAYYADSSSTQNDSTDSLLLDTSDTEDRVQLFIAVDGPQNAIMLNMSIDFPTPF